MWEVTCTQHKVNSAQAADAQRELPHSPTGTGVRNKGTPRPPTLDSSLNTRVSRLPTTHQCQILNRARPRHKSEASWEDTAQEGTQHCTGLEATMLPLPFYSFFLSRYLLGFKNCNL